MSNGRNYNVYISGMEKSLQEKLFFLEHLDITKYKRIIDFGCGSGDVLMHISKLVPETTELIGIDTDQYMLKLTAAKVPSAKMSIFLDREMLDGETLIIFNSVLHEVGIYIYELVKKLKGTGATVAIRDMSFSSSVSHLQILPSDLAKLVRYSNPQRLADFIDKYGMNNVEDMYHYLLKYSYVDNWKLELEEDYFSFKWEVFIHIMDESIFHNDYTLEFKKNKVKEDFDVDMIFPTHIQWIFTVAKEN